MIREITTAGLIAFTAHGLLAQPGPAAFEVASVKANQSGGRRGAVRAESEGLTGKNVTLKQLMLYAYQLQGAQLLGPDWIETEGYDVAATVKNSPSDAQLRLMLQALLEDRFKLKLHRETRELPVYFLIVAKSGPKLRDGKEGEAAFAALRKDGRSPFKPGQMAIFTNKEMSGLIERLPLDRPVVDKTGLNGRFWFQLEWAPDLSQTGSEGRVPRLLAGPSLLSALEEQLGLTLEAQRASVETLIIDRVERPSEN